MKKSLLFLFMFAVAFTLHADDTSKKTKKESDDKFCVVPEDGNSNQTTFVFTKSDDGKKSESKKDKKEMKDGDSCSPDKDSKEKSCCSTDKKKSDKKEDPKK